MDEEFWYCLKHHAVEGREGCKASDRLGPYANASDAARALEIVAQRNEKWDNDPVWNKKDDWPDDEDDS